MSLWGTCAHPRCDVAVHATLFACRDHWFSLPGYIRDDITGSYAIRHDGGSAVHHRRAMAAAYGHWRHLLAGDTP